MSQKNKINKVCVFLGRDCYCFLKFFSLGVGALDVVAAIMGFVLKLQHCIGKVCALALITPDSLQALGVIFNLSHSQTHPYQ